MIAAREETTTSLDPQLETWLVEALNKVLNICQDGCKVYREAADVAQASRIRTLMKKYELQRATYAQQLEYHIKYLGGVPDKATSLAGSLQRQWLNIRKFVHIRGDQAILAECGRTDERILSYYETALEKPFPETIRNLLTEQQQQISAARQSLYSLKADLA